jgi:TM2 domain-containing membrane protein YozV
MPKFCPECGAAVRPPAPEKTEIRDPWVALILSFFCAGWGQWYNGSAVGGLKFFLSSLGLGIPTLALVFTSIIGYPMSGMMGLYTS